MQPAARLIRPLAGAALGAASYGFLHAASRGPVVADHEAEAFRRINGLPGIIAVPIYPLMQFGSLASVGVTAGVLARSGRGEIAAAALAAGTATWVLAKAGKRLHGRGRPDRHLAGVRIRGRRQSGLGYPSGHAAVSMTLALVAGTGRSRPTRAALVGLAGIVGLSRIHIGAHLPVDVAGGFAMGAAIGGGAVALLRTRNGE